MPRVRISTLALCCSILIIKNVTDARFESKASFPTPTRGRCSVCIEREYAQGGTISINFKDVKEESNWNQERFNSGRHRDCTMEKIFHGRPIKMVQFFPSDDSTHCICSIRLACHQSVAGFEKADVELSRAFLKEHWRRNWASWKFVRGQCPDGCAHMSKKLNGLKGMNILRNAMKCKAGDEECKHRFVQIW